MREKGGERREEREKEREQERASAYLSLCVRETQTFTDKKQSCMCFHICHWTLFFEARKDSTVTSSLVFELMSAFGNPNTPVDL
jgi:hypothetical protein